MVAKMLLSKYVMRRSPPEVFLGKGVLKICSKFTGEQSWTTVLKLFRHGHPPPNLLHTLRTPFLNNTSEVLLRKSAALPVWWTSKFLKSRIDYQCFMRWDLNNLPEVTLMQFEYFTWPSPPHFIRLPAIKLIFLVRIFLAFSCIWTKYEALQGKAVGKGENLE